MDKGQLIDTWLKYAEGQSTFKLNPDTKWVDAVADGVLTNEKNTGLRFCPCRLRKGDLNEDVVLLCPCNFMIQKNWTEKGQCWCGLFVKE